MTKIIGNSSVYGFRDPATIWTHGSTRWFRIRNIIANYFRHNIEFTLRLLGFDDVTQEKNYFLTWREGFASMKGNPKKASAIGRRNLLTKKKKDVKTQKGTKMFLCLLWEKVENVCQAHGFFVFPLLSLRSSLFGDFLTTETRAKSVLLSLLFRLFISIANLQFDNIMRNEFVYFLY